MRLAWTSQAVFAVLPLAAGCRSPSAEPPPPAVDAAAPAAPETDGDATRAAREVKEQVLRASRENRWNDALTGVYRLKEICRDDAARQTIGFDALAADTAKGRDEHFRGEVPRVAYARMRSLIDAKARETSDAATLAAARQWISRELPVAMWDGVVSDLGLEQDELEKYWKMRVVPRPLEAAYGSGTFVVARNAAGDASAASGRRPLSDEEWWRAADPAERTRFLTALFVETSGMFEILRVDVKPCGACGGSGRTAGPSAATTCPQCHGDGRCRSVVYR